MTDLPHGEFEWWSPRGEMLARRAHYAALVHGALIVAFVATFFLMAISERTTTIGPLICFVFALLFAVGITIMTMSGRIEERRRGATIALFVMTLILSLLALYHVGRLVLYIAMHGFKTWRPDWRGWTLDSIELCIAISGLIAVWNCIGTLRNWPKRSGTAFHVELTEPPKDWSQENDRAAD